MISNTAFKAVIAASLGAPAFRRVSLAGLAGFAVAIALGALIVGPA
jgi:hypothetical protein